MKIPHHLYLARSGRWHFRKRVPADLLEQVGRRYIKKSLGTSRLAVAQVRAIAVNAQCLSIFTALRAQHMPSKPRKPANDDDGFDRFEYTIRLPDGLLISAEGPDDHARALEIVEKLPELLRQNVTTPTTPASPTAKSVKLSEAARDWVLSLANTTIPKTRSQMKAAVENFVAYRRSAVLHEIRRHDIAEWVQMLDNSGLAPNTIMSKVSYLTRFFEWAINAGYYPPGDNPARRQFKYSKKQKKLRQEHSFRALAADEVAVLYAPTCLSTLSTAKRWAALLGLYTGARVSEIAQLALDDVLEVDGCLTLHIRAEKRGQSVKTHGSERRIPVHQDLVQVGFSAYVESLREAGETWLFPTSKVDTVNGRGSSFSAAFSRHVRQHLPAPETQRRVGFHSLRKTVNERMQDARVPSEFRMRYLGHEPNDVHHSTYSRKYEPNELAEVVHPALRFGLDIEGIAAVVGEQQRRRRPGRKTR